MKSITTKIIKIPKIQTLDNNYIENYLKNMSYNVIRWAITDTNNSEITLTVSHIK